MAFVGYIQRRQNYAYVGEFIGGAQGNTLPGMISGPTLQVGEQINIGLVVHTRTHRTEIMSFGPRREDRMLRRELVGISNFGATTHVSMNDRVLIAQVDQLLHEYNFPHESKTVEAVYPHDLRRRSEHVHITN